MRRIVACVSIWLLGSMIASAQDLAPQSPDAPSPQGVPGWTVTLNTEEFDARPQTGVVNTPAAIDIRDMLSAGKGFVTMTA